MTETEGAEVDELAELLWRADRDASASAIGFAAMFRDDSCQFAYRAQARAILTSDWLAAREAAAEARGAARVLAAVEAVGWHHLGDDYYAGAMEHAREDILAAARAAAGGGS